MSATVMPPSKSQPAVLHLLPFSRNDAGSGPRAPQQKPEPGPAALYGGDTQDTSRSFPVLAVTRSERAAAKLRSKSASVALYNVTSPSLQDNGAGGHSRDQQRRLLRASSERLSRAQAASRSGVGDVMSLVKSRAKSEYGVYSTTKPETVRCAVKDINDEILGATSAVVLDSNHGNSGLILSPEPLQPATFGREKKLKSLPKPTAKIGGEGHWSHGKTRFWRSSTTSPGEMELRKHKINLDLDRVSSGRPLRRVKLNVNELPRSKTPIAENDPDKLNMKQVIAFLQSNSKDSTTADTPHSDNANSFSHRSTFLVSARPTHQAKPSPAPQQKSQDSSPLKIGKNGMISGKHYIIKPSSMDTKDYEQKAVVRNSEKTAFRHSSFRPKTYHAGGADVSMSDGKIVKSDYLAHTIGRGAEERQRPKSLHASIDSRNVHIPESIRKLRDTDDQTKPFRLHRFVTLVPNGSADLLNSAESKSVHFQTSRSRTSSRESARSFVEKSGHNATRHHQNLLPRRPRTESSSYIHGIGSLEPDPRPPSEGRRRGKRQGRGGTPISNTAQSVDKVICLPRAQFEAESDDEGSPFPTMPNSRNRRAATLSAQGRAITPGSDRGGVKGNAQSSPGLNGLAAGPRKERIPAGLENHNDIDGTYKPGKENENVPYHDKNNNSVDSNISSGIHDPANDSAQPGNNFSSTRIQNAAPQSTFGVTSTIGNGAPESSSSSSHRSPPQSLPDWAKNEQRGSTSPDTSIRSPSEAGGGSPTSSHRSQQNFFLTSLEPVRTVRIDGVMTSSADKHGEATSPGLVMPKDQVRLSLRKERHRTRELTYMVDMASAGSADDVMSKRTSLNSPG